MHQKVSFFGKKRSFKVNIGRKRWVGVLIK